MNIVYLGTLLLGLIVAGGLVWGFLSLLKNITDKQELKKFIILGFIFCLIIGAYWMLHPIKDSFFSVIVGDKYRGIAKNVSVILVSVLVLVYSKLLDLFSKQKVIYILTTAYTIALLVFMIFFMSPTIGLANTVAAPSRLIGWAWYAFVESIGSLVVAVFWAFATDITQPDSAKRGFPIMVLFAQLGNILGPLTTVLFLQKFGSGIPFVGIAALLLFLAGPLVWLFLKITPKTYLVGFHGTEKKEQVGFFDGLKLLVTKPYLLCILAIVTMFELLVTILDIYLKGEVHAVYQTEVGTTLFLAKFAVVVGVIALLSLIFRIGQLPKILGIRLSLVLLPVLVITGFVVLNFAYNFGYLLQGLFAVVAAFKAINYALNAPTLKQLYIPTTKDAKYKSQAWIETFGARSAKAGGGLLDYAKQFVPLSWHLPGFLCLSIGVVGLVWMPAVLYASKKYNQAIKKNEVVC